MRITKQQIKILKDAVNKVVGEQAKIWLFGSRLDDNARGGDIDILVSLDNIVEKPASTVAKISAKVMMKMQGQKIDVLLEAPNLEKLPIHTVVHNQGILL